MALGLNGEKCVLGVNKVEYLGHVVSATGVQPLPDKVEAISGFPKPANSKSLQRFLEMLNFYCRFVLGAARTLKPLTDALCGGRKEKYRVLEKRSKAFKVLNGKKENWVSVDRLKAYWGPFAPETGSEDVPTVS